MTAEQKVLAWFMAWHCGCSQTAAAPDDLPDRCPGHQREPLVLSRPEQLEVLAEYAEVHLCGENPNQEPCPSPEPGAAA